MYVGIRRKEALIQELYAGIGQKEALIQELYVGIRQIESLIQETRPHKSAVNPDDSRRAAKFLRTVPNADVEEKLVRSEMSLFCEDDVPNALIVRECYDKIYGMIAEHGDNHEGLYTQIVRVTGSPCTGKTVCGIYVVR